ncbi:MAG: YceI family protein [Bacteroidetes bacterium]|nr:YceI family protein [Bacteroidota bacterium]
MAKWTIDPSHSEVGFKVKHLMITNVKGSFRDYNATITTEGEDFVNPNVEFTAKTASIDTADDKRDAHLRSADFFDSENYPELKFISTGYERIDTENFTLYGDLTIKNITKPVKLNVVFEGIMKDPYGQTKAGFTIEGKFNRKEWELNWNAALEAGGVLVGDEIRVMCEVQMTKEA